MKQLSDLAFFSELVRHESLASAAVAFDVTPPAVSRRLAALEKRLGVRLLNRSTRRLDPTPLGQSYYESALRLLSEVEQVEQGIAATYQIRSIPTLALFKQGKEVDRVSGALPPAQLQAWLARHGL